MACPSALGAFPGLRRTDALVVWSLTDSIHVSRLLIPVLFYSSFSSTTKVLKKTIRHSAVHRDLWLGFRRECLAFGNIILLYGHLSLIFVAAHSIAQDQRVELRIRPRHLRLDIVQCTWRRLQRADNSLQRPRRPFRKDFESAAGTSRFIHRLDRGTLAINLSRPFPVVGSTFLVYFYDSRVGVTQQFAFELAHHLPHQAKRIGSRTR